MKIKLLAAVIASLSTGLIGQIALENTNDPEIPDVNGWVQGFDEGYAKVTSLVGIIETKTGVISNPTIEIWTRQTADYDGHSGDLYVGVIFPLTLNDNTYGANVAEDWLTSEKGAHKLKELEGSDQWDTEVTVAGTITNFHMNVVSEVQLNSL